MVDLLSRYMYRNIYLSSFDSLAKDENRDSSNQTGKADFIGIASVGINLENAMKN